jgi:hypothetical protein
MKRRQKEEHRCVTETCASIENDRLYTPEEAAPLVHERVTPRHLRQAIYAKRLAATRIGKVVLITGTELRRFLKASTCPAQTPVPASSSTDPTADTAQNPAATSAPTPGT